MHLTGIKTIADFKPPFFVMAMPINERGAGPEMEPEFVAEVLWQVWDQANTTVCWSHDRLVAVHLCELLNREQSHTIYPDSGWGN